MGPSSGGGKSIRPITPNVTLGNQTAAKQSGYKTMAERNALASFADSQ